MEKKRKLCFNGKEYTVNIPKKYISNLEWAHKDVLKISMNEAEKKLQLELSEKFEFDDNKSTHTTEVKETEKPKPPFYFDPNLLHYVRNQMGHGIGKEDILQKLLGMGWKKETIYHLFDYLSRDSDQYHGGGEGV